MSAGSLRARRLFARLPFARLLFTCIRRRLSAGRCAAAIALAILCALQMIALLRAPGAWMPAQVAVTLARGASLVLDHAALGAPPGAARLTLRRDAGGGWWASADAAHPLLQAGARLRRSGSVALAAGQQVQLGAATFTVDAADGATVAFSRADAHRRYHWRYDGAVLQRDGAAQPACPDAHLGARLAGLWNRAAPSALRFARPLVFGGNLDCGNRIASAGLAAPAATIVRGADGMMLAAGAGADAAPLLLADGAGTSSLAERALALTAGQVLIAGRTHLLIAADGDVLRLRPVSHIALTPQAQRPLPAGVAWTWTRRPTWQLAPSAIGAAGTVASIVAGLALAAGLAALCTGTRGRSPVRPRLRTAALAGGGVLLAGAGILLFWLQRSGAPAGAGLTLLVAWAALWTALLAPRRLDAALGAGLLLLALGLLAQLDLGLGAPDTSWLRHFQKTAALLALGCGAATLLALAYPARPGRPLRTIAQARVEVALLLLTACALVALLLQVAYGDETGVFDVQPVEFAKLALAALSAHCLALASGRQPAAGGAWLRALRLVAPALLFMLLLAVALVQVDDYSPLVLLALWGGAMALAQALATRRRGAVVLLAALAVLGVLAVVGLRSAGVDGIARWDFYADRFLVWLDPGTHPHTGQQLLLGAQAIAEGGWAGADGAFGLSTLGQDPGFALRIPAVQDDFAASFFLQRHGLAASLALWLLQALFLAALLRLAVQCWLQGAAARDFRQAWAARLRCFFLTGGAAFAFGHFLLSWGTNLAIFPVMGQPMSFLSAGGSHLLFFICPLLGVAAASSPSLEENESCRSTSNMKSWEK
jgi:cell division protein FtsW